MAQAHNLALKIMALTIFVAFVSPSRLGHCQTKGELNPTPTNTPTATATPCQDLSRPTTGRCDTNYVQTLVAGSQRCVPKCPDGQRSFNHTCPTTQSTTQCLDCARDCSTCAFKKVEFDNRGGNFDGDRMKEFDKVFEVFNGRPSCINEKRAASASDWAILPSQLPAEALKYMDDQLMSRALSRFNGIIGEINYNRVEKRFFCNKLLYDNNINTTYPPKYLRCTFRCPVGSSRCAAGANGDGYSPLCHNYEGKCADGYFFVDNSCNTVQVSTAEENACNVSLAAKINYVASSPISLIWSRNHDLLRNYSLVRFPLDLAATDRWYAWHASAEAPLLVYDPSHRGSVTTPQQLFGNWTFGGQRAAKYSDTAQAPTPKPWRDGYEALASLDQDGDGALADGELAPLGLWFDRDRDGVSQPGEVRSIVEARVTRIFTGPTIPVTSSRAVKVQRGFIREDAAGHQIEGETIDWYSEGAQTMGELMARQDFHTSKRDSERLDSPGQVSATSAIPWAMGDIVANSPLNGRWIWSDPKDETKLEHGALELVERSDGGISGMALSQVNLETDLSMRHAIGFKVLNGRVSKRAGKSLDFTFSSIDSRGANGTKPSVETTATLDTESRVLTGITTQYIGEGTSQRKVEYRWVAHQQTDLKAEKR